MISQEAWMDLKLLHRQGMSLRAISRATGLARQTVKRALAQTVPSTYKLRPPRPHKLDPFKEHLGTELGARPWVTAAQLYREITPQGYGGHYEAVKVYCRGLRQQALARRRACVRFETGPGVEAQFDWKGPLAGLLADEPRAKVFVFRLVLCWSRFRISRAVTLTTLPAILADLGEALTRLGGVPRRLVFDNFKAAVLRPRPNLRLHPFFADFCAHYGVEPQPALPYSPQRKGKNERSFRDLEQSGLAHQTYADLNALQAALDEADAEHARRLHSTTGETPAVRLERERAFLGPLPEVAFDPRLPETRRVLSDCTLSYRGACYSVPYLLVGKRLTVKADLRTGVMEVFDGAELAASHRLVPGGQRIIVEEHIAPLRRPRWDRVRGGSPVKALPPAASPAGPQLVNWPLVSVEQRPLTEYARLIEEVAR